MSNINHMEDIAQLVNESADLVQEVSNFLDMKVADLRSTYSKPVVRKLIAAATAITASLHDTAADRAFESPEEAKRFIKTVYDQLIADVDRPTPKPDKKVPTAKMPTKLPRPRAALPLDHISSPPSIHMEGGPKRRGT